MIRLNHARVHCWALVNTWNYSNSLDRVRFQIFPRSTELLYLNSFFSTIQLKKRLRMKTPVSPVLFPKQPVSVITYIIN
jgi:hypothetical protein